MAVVAPWSFPWPSPAVTDAIVLVDALPIGRHDDATAASATTPTRRARRQLVMGLELKARSPWGHPRCRVWSIGELAAMVPWDSPRLGRQISAMPALKSACPDANPAFRTHIPYNTATGRLAEQPLTVSIGAPESLARSSQQICSDVVESPAADEGQGSVDVVAVYVEHPGNSGLAVGGQTPEPASPTHGCLSA